MLQRSHITYSIWEVECEGLDRRMSCFLTCCPFAVLSAAVLSSRYICLSLFLIFFMIFFHSLFLFPSPVFPLLAYFARILLINSISLPFLITPSSPDTVAAGRAGPGKAGRRGAGGAERRSSGLQDATGGAARSRVQALQGARQS